MGLSPILVQLRTTVILAAAATAASIVVQKLSDKFFTKETE